jgi:hypothetical protein
MRIPQPTKILLFALLTLMSISGFTNATAQDVIRASGGTELSIDKVNTTEFATLSGPTIRETATGQLVQNGTIRLTLPAGYQWNSSLNANNITITVDPVGAQNTDLAVAFTSISNSEVVFTVTTASRTAGGGRGPGRVTIGGLQLQPTTTTIPNIGQISNTGTTGPDVNYGDLSTTEGVISAVRVETAPDGSGEIVQEQNLRAGDPLMVYSIARDIGGNFIENIALSDEADWSLINISGGINPASLVSSTGRRSATFSSQITGSAQVQAFRSGVDLVPSETITVTPRSASQLQINTQPSTQATAGEIFDPQPVINLLDQFGNLVTTDSETEVTVEIASGDGSLSGTLTETAVNGIVEFSDLSTNLANVITLQFLSDGFISVVSNEISVLPGPINQLNLTSFPTSGGQNSPISPAIVQLLDQFGNRVEESGTQVNTSLESGDGQLLGTLQETTNSAGEAIFDNLIFDTDGTKTIRAELDVNNSIFTISDAIEILGAGSVTNFKIESVDNEPIGTQIAGEPFDIRITAIDGEGDEVPDFDGTVDLSSTSNILSGGGTTSPFVDGVLDTHTITLSESGTHTVTAVRSDQTFVSGSSNTFIVNPSEVDFANTVMFATPAQIVADGESTTQITVQLRDEFENNLISGGETITMETTEGELEGLSETGQSVTATDNSDGTYTATLTSGTDVVTATLEAFESGNSIATLLVPFSSGVVQQLRVILPQDGAGPESQIAGEPFEITVEAVDENGNRAASYSGDISLSTNSIITAGETATVTNGILQNHSVTLTRSGNNITITAADIETFGIDGTSDPFTVLASSPDLDLSEVVASPSVIRNDGSSQSIVSIILRDQFSNRILTDFSSDITFNATQVEENGSPSSGTPDATVGSIIFNSSTSVYEINITSSTTNELIEFTADYSGSPISQTAFIQIVTPNIWQPSGNPAQRVDWTRADNWSLGSEPGPNDFVVIPGGAADYPDLDLNVSIGSLEVEEDAQLVLFGGNSINVAGNININGTLDIEDNTSLIVGGSFIGNGTFASGSAALIEIAGNISISSLLARVDDTILRLNGSTQQIITTSNLLVQKMEVLNDVLVTAAGGFVDTGEIFIDDGFTFEFETGANITVDNLRNIFGNGSLILNDNTLVVRGDLSLLNIDTRDGTVIFGIRIGEDFADYPDLQQQQIGNLSAMRNAVINNINGVRTFDDVIIENGGEIILENGELIIGSGRNFIASNITYNNGFLTFRRTISQPGWRMMSTPVGTSYQDFFNGLTLQGISGSSYPDRQPNLLFYDETFPGTDNQRWRTPGNSSESFVDGKGYFFYVFGNVVGDDDYNDPLPTTLTASGQENIPQATDFSMPVTYTAEADTGWNMVGNPFGATINWDDAGWTKNNMDNVIYIWDANTGEYRYWNGVAGSHGSGRIAPFQGFWVKANAENPELRVNPSAKTVDGIFRKVQSRYENIPVLAFNLESNFHSTSTHLTFTEKGSFNTDPLDAYRLLPFDANTYLEVYSMFKDGTELAINNLPRDFGKVIEIPVQVGAVKDGRPYSGLVTLTWPEFENIPDSWKIELYDHHTKETINLRNHTFYDFEIRSQGKEVVTTNTMRNFRLLEKSKANSANSRFTLFIDPGSDGSEFPAEVQLNQNYPNPFNPSTTIQFGLPTEDRVRIDVYDAIGRRVHTITDQRFQAGYHQLEFDGRSLASGVYFYRLRTSTKVIDKRMTLIK